VGVSEGDLDWVDETVHDCESVGVGDCEAEGVAVTEAVWDGVILGVTV